MKKVFAIGLAAVLAAAMIGCSSSSSEDSSSEESTASTSTASASSEESDSEDDSSSAEATGGATVTVFIAASLEDCFKDLITNFNAQYPEVTINYNADSSGTLQTQIQEGAACDLFFSAATKQMDALEEGGYITEGTRVDYLKNCVVVIAGKDNGTTVTGLETLSNAQGSVAIADGSVPVGNYTRKALVSLGILDSVDDTSLIETATIQEKLGVEVNECSNVSKVKEAVKEGASEVGTVYKTDAYSVIDNVDILEEVSTDLTGDILYPVALVNNSEADEAQTEAAKAFYDYLMTDEAKATFEQYLYEINE